MGLIYVSTESSELINALKANISSGKEASNQLKSGSQKIISAVDGKTLSGAAYTAGKGLFSDLILPTISKVTSAIDELETELQSYISANDTVSSEATLNEDRLNEQIRTIKAQKTAVEASLAVVKAASNKNTVARMLNVMLNVQSTLTNMANDFDDDIRDLEKKLEKLRKFSSETSNLFSDSLSNLKIAMQSVTVLNNTIVNSDGTYQLPEGVDISWFNSLKNDSDVEKMEDSALKAAIKDFNELYSKNPMAAIEKVKNNDRLFSYIVSILDSNLVPEGAKNAVLDIFITQESWNQLPKDLALKVLNNPKFAQYVNGKSEVVQVAVFGALTKLSDKGWDVLAPLGSVTNVLSKSSNGEKYLAASKELYKKFSKIAKVADFISKYKGLGEILSYGGDVLTVGSLTYKEYIDPDSPAYQNVSKSTFGGLNRFLVQAGPLEGAQYGYVPGAVMGTINTIVQGIEIQTPFKQFGNDGKIGWDGINGFGTEEEMDKWVAEQYEIYDERHEHIENGETDKIKEDWFGKQNGRVDVGDFNTGLPKW